jgi:hypothetical protein
MELRAASKHNKLNETAILTSEDGSGGSCVHRTIYVGLAHRLVRSAPAG